MTREEIINLANRCSRKIWEICMEEPVFSTNDCPEDYISFETAKLLKEKGFSCDEISCIKVFKGHTYKIQGTIIDADEDVTIPTIQLVMKWLREVHNLHINVDIHWLHFINQNGWMYVITKILESGIDYIDSNGDENDKHFYFTYEESCEAGIRYCLEKLI